MGKYVSDLFVGGFVIIMTVIFLRRPGEANQLISGTFGTYTKTVSDLSQL